MSRFGRTEKAIFSIAIIVLVAFSYFLYDDSLLFPKTTNNTLQFIGTMAVSQNDVRRKNIDTFSWIPASHKDRVYQNDSIFTGDRSEAVVELQDGTHITIQPNSLITLNLNNGQMSLDLRYGNLVGDIAKGTSLTVKTGTEEFQLESTKEPSKVQLNKTHTTKVDLRLIKGDVKYVNKKKKAVQELPKDAVVAVNPKGDVKPVEPPKLTLITGDNLNWLRANPNDPIPFEWSGKGDISRYELEISATEDFSQVALSKATSGGQLMMVDPLQAGPYFWRVKAYDGSGYAAVTSPTRKMMITHLASPVIVNPAQDTQISLELKVKTPDQLVTSTQVQWKAMPILKNFKWQIAKDPEFQEVLKEEVTAKFNAVTPNLPNGTYWLRVQGKTDKEALSPWSPAVSFNVNLVAYKEERPDRPILVVKNIKLNLPTGKDRNPASFPAPKLAWKPVAKSKQYQLQISKDPSFAESEKINLPETEMDWAQFRPGKHYYRVYAQGINGLSSPSSEVGTIEVSIGELHLNPLKSISKVGESAGPQQAPVTWTEVPFAKSYLLQMDKSKEFKQPTQLSFTNATGQVTLPGPGKYHVRVQALDENNQHLTSFSNSEEVLYTFRNPLTTPMLIEPFNKASIFLQTEMEPFVWLEWKRVEGATTYTLEVSDKPDFSSKLIATTVVNGNRYLIKQRVPLGKIYWRVRAEAAADKETSDWTEQREFTLHHQKNETFVK